MKKWMGLLGLLLTVNQVHATPVAQVFVSFSMPPQLLAQTLKDCAAHRVPVVLNGFIHNSMADTVKRIGQLSTEVPGVSMQIDPTLFERFSIDKVPALVVSDDSRFDVIYGHLSLKEGISRIQDRGEIGLSAQAVKEILGE